MAPLIASVAICSSGMGRPSISDLKNGAASTAFDDHKSKKRAADGPPFHTSRYMQDQNLKLAPARNVRPISPGKCQDAR
jgi:hypothetical protein